MGTYDMCFGAVSGSSKWIKTPYKRNTIPYKRTMTPYKKPYKRSLTPYKRATIPYKRATAPYKRTMTPYKKPYKRATAWTIKKSWWAQRRSLGGYALKYRYGKIEWELTVERSFR
ncbi:MAG: hypothetical protein HUK01_06090 [Bacteroidaceae bacterium]|nr:hypothetical protein [Bacteroidaceae bacterium]